MGEVAKVAAKSTRGTPAQWWQLVKDAVAAWVDDKAPRLGAALSYYTVFALAPLLLVVIAVAGMVFGRQAAEGRLLAQLAQLVGVDAASALQAMLAKAALHGGGAIATVIGLVTLGVGATGVVVELQDALNTVWKVVPKPGRGIRGLIRDRLLSVGVVLGFGFLLIVSLVASAGLAAAGTVMRGWLPGWMILGYVLNYGVSIGVIGVMLAMIFKVLPDVKISWSDVWIGAFVTSALFHIGKFLIGLYVGKASVGSTFGAAGSLAVLLVWIYYTSQLVLLGAVGGEERGLRGLNRDALVELLVVLDHLFERRRGVVVEVGRGAADAAQVR